MLDNLVQRQFAHRKVGLDLPSLSSLEGTRDACCVYVLLFDIFKPSSSSSALVFTSFYASLQGIAITQDQGAVGKANTLILKGKSNVLKSLLGFFDNHSKLPFVSALG